ncbi:MAG TPA: hypothetical protein VLE50_02425 [Cellvibrio sp.]|nr:hypothetical protein [Cellvibrio sp.]
MTDPVPNASTSWVRNCINGGGLPIAALGTVCATTTISSRICSGESIISANIHDHRGTPLRSDFDWANKIEVEWYTNSNVRKHFYAPINVSYHAMVKASRTH